MLLGQSRSALGRVLRVLAALLVTTLGGIALAWAGAQVGIGDWPPSPSGTVGVVCGFIGGAIVFFEMAIVFRKWFRGRRLFKTKLWMRLHIWLGLICLPVILIHAGFGFGGRLPAITLILFLLVTFSGVYGLILQQWLPQRILESIPGETIAVEVDYAIKTHVLEVERLVAKLTSLSPEELEGQEDAPRVEPIVVGGARVELENFCKYHLIPYLERGRYSKSVLASRTQSVWQFRRLRGIVPDEAGPVVNRFEALCDLRRQWDTLRRMNNWLHAWLLVHLPLSWMMTLLMVVHAIRALKYW